MMTAVAVVVMMMVVVVTGDDWKHVLIVFPFSI
jgi:hypothetical protein